MLFRSNRSFSYQLKNRSYRTCIMRVAVVSETIMVSFFFISIGKKQTIISAFACIPIPFKFCFVRGVTYANSWCMTLISVYEQAKINIVNWFKFAPVQTIIHIQWILFNILGYINLSWSYKSCTEYNSFLLCLL